MTYGTVSKSTIAVSSTLAKTKVPFASAMRLSDSNVGVPGDIVNIRVNYAGFEKSENTDLLLSITNGAATISIGHVNFITSPSGNGSVETSWTIPWNKALAGHNNWHVLAHASNMMQKVVSGENSVTITSFTDDDSIFSNPSNGEVVTFDSSYTVRWNGDLLSYFLEIAGKEKSTPCLSNYCLK